MTELALIILHLINMKKIFKFAIPAVIVGLFAAGMTYAQVTPPQLWRQVGQWIQPVTNTLGFRIGTTNQFSVDNSGNATTTNLVITGTCTGCSTGSVPTSRNINTTAPLQGGGNLSADRTLSIAQASSTANGYLSSTDFNTFNNKQTTIAGGTNINITGGNTINVINSPVFSGTLTVVGTSTLATTTITNLKVNGNTISGANSGDVTLSGQNYITIAGQALTANAVDLSGTNATGVLAAGRFPALSGDISTSAGALSTTLATVNSNIGSFGSSTLIPNFTVNAKGLITAAGTNAVIAPAGTLTGTTLASNVVSSSLTSVGTLGNLTVSGQTNLGNASGTNLSLSGNLYVTGQSFYTGTSTQATTTITKLTVTGIPTFSGISDCNGSQFSQITSGVFGCSTPSVGSSASSTWTQYNGGQRNGLTTASSTEAVTIGSTTPQTTTQLFVQGNGTKNPFTISSSTGISFFNIAVNGSTSVATLGTGVVLNNSTLYTTPVLPVALGGTGTTSMNSLALANLVLNSSNLSFSGGDGLQVLIGTTTTISLSDTPTFTKITSTNSSTSNFTLLNNFYVPGMANGCLQVTSGTATSTGVNCGTGGGSGNSAWTIGTGLIYNATTTDSVLIGTTTPTTAKLFVQGSGTKNPITIASSSGATLLGMSTNGSLTLQTTATSSTSLLLQNPSGQTTLQVDQTQTNAGVSIGTTSAASTLIVQSSPTATPLIIASSTGGTLLTLSGAGILTINNLATGCLQSSSGVVSSTGLACGSGGGGTASGTAGSVQFSDGSGGFNADQSNFVWNNSNKRLGLGTASPVATLSVAGTLNVTSTSTFADGLTIADFPGQNNTWINFPTTGAAGIGTGGPGSNPWIAYSAATSQWFTNAQTGDVNYRNGSSNRILIGIDNGTGNANSQLLFSSSGVFLNQITGSTQCLHVNTSGLISGNGGLDCGTITGSGTNGFSSRFIGPTTLGNGVLLDNGTVAGVNATSSAINFLVQGTPTNATTTLFAVASSSGQSIFQVGTVNSTGGQGRVYINPQNPGDVSSTAALEIDSASGNNSDLIFKNVGSGSPTTGLANASGTPSSVTNLTATNATIGSYDFYTWVPTSNWVRNARIVASADGTLSTSSAPSLLVFQTAASGTVSTLTRMRIDSIGNVSVGNFTSPARFSVLGTPNTTLLNLASSTGVSLLSVSQEGRLSVGGNALGSNLGVQGTAGQTTSLFNVVSSTASSYLIVSAAGNVGIASSTPNFKLSVAGTVAMTGLTTSAANQPTTICQAATGELISDTVTGGCVLSTKRVKTDIEKGDYGLDLFLNLKNNSYFYKTDWLGSLSTNPNYAPKQEGVIAEDVAALAPNLVTYETSTSTYDNAPPGTVHGLQDFAHWIGPITQAFQDLQKEIDNIQVGKVKRSAEENWQWLVMGLLTSYVFYNEWDKRRKK